MITGTLCGIDHGLTMSFRPLTPSANMTYLLSSRKTSWTYSTPRPLFLLPRSKKGKSGSLDGWGGTEVALWPVSMWTSLHGFPTHADTFPAVPAEWAILKQAHIPKDKPGTAQDGACKCASTLRPISVLSVFWRIWISAKMKLPELQTWYDSVLCPSQYGCRRKTRCAAGADPYGADPLQKLVPYQLGPSSSL